MSRYLITHDGLYLGSSSACNLVTCVRLAKKLGRGSRIVTILWISHGERCVKLIWVDAIRGHGIRASFGRTITCERTGFRLIHLLLISCWRASMQVM